MNPEDFEAIASSMNIKVNPVASTGMSVTYWVEDEYGYKELVNILGRVQSHFIISSKQQVLTLITRKFHHGRNAHNATPV